MLQSLREFFASVYFYNLISLSISPVTLLIFIAFLPLLTGRLVRSLGFRNSFLLTGAVMVAGRIPMGMGMERPAHLIFSTISFSGALLFLPVILSLHKRERKIDPEAFSSQSLIAFFGIAYLLILFFNAAGHGIDTSIVPEASGMMLSPGITMIISGILGISLFLQRDSLILDRTRSGDDHPGSTFSGGIADSWAPAWGIGGSIFVLMGIVSNPSVTSGWIGVEFELSLSMTMASLSLFLLSLLSSSGILLALRRTFSNPKGAVLGNLIMLLAAANLFFLGIPIPVAPAFLVWMAMVNTWVIFDAATDHRPFAGESFQIDSSTGRKIIGFPHRSKTRDFPGHFGKAMSLGIGSFILLIVFITISLNWSFVPMGVVLKGAVPTLMFLGFVILALSGFSCSKFRIEEPWVKIDQSTLHLEKGSPTTAAGKGTGDGRGLSKVSPRLRIQWLMLGAITISFIIGTGAVSLWNYGDQPEERILGPGDTIRVATYNIHHGFTNDGRIDPSEHLELLQGIDADIIFLQESDSLLFSEGNFDPAFYIASRMDMFLFRGPDPGTGSPGVAILSKFPMEETEVHFLPSTAIQRIALSCLVEIRDEPVRLVGIHMGLEEEERNDQMEELSEIVSDYDEEVILGGDLNTEPHEEMMELMNDGIFGDGNNSDNRTSLGLQSVWHSSPDRGGRPIGTPTYPSPDVDDERTHIDYVLFTDGFRVLESRIVDGEGISDHRLVWGELEPVS